MEIGKACLWLNHHVYFENKQRQYRQNGKSLLKQDKFILLNPNIILIFHRIEIDVSKRTCNNVDNLPQLIL